MISFPSIPSQVVLSFLISSCKQDRICKILIGSAMSARLRLKGWMDINQISQAVQHHVLTFCQTHRHSQRYVLYQVQITATCRTWKWNLKVTPL